MNCDTDCGPTLRTWLGTALLLPLLSYALAGCALPHKPPSSQTSADCAERAQEIIRLQRTLAEKDAEIQKLLAQKNVQADALEQTTGEVARAEVRLRRLATHADAASQLAEAEVSLQALRSETYPPRAGAQLEQAKRILDAGSTSFSQGNYGMAVELAAQSQELMEMTANSLRESPSSAHDSVEVPFQIPVTLRTRIDSNLRAHPRHAASILSVLRQGTSLQAQGYNGEWLRVRTEDGRTGWVFGNLLEAPQPAVE